MGNIDNAAPNNVIFIRFNHFMGPKCSKGATIKDLRYVALCSSSNQVLSVAYALSMGMPTFFPSMEMPLPTPAI